MVTTTTTEVSVTTSWAIIGTGVTSLLAQVYGQGVVILHVGASLPVSDIGVVMDHHMLPGMYIPNLLIGDNIYAKVKGKPGDTVQLTLINFAP